MHEMSVAMEVCRMAEEQLGIDRLPQLRAVGLRVGSEAGVVAENLEFCLETLLSHPPFAGAAPELERCGGDVLQLEYLVLEEGDEADAEGPEAGAAATGAGDEAGHEEGGRP